MRLCIGRSGRRESQIQWLTMMQGLLCFFVVQGLRRLSGLGFLSLFCRGGRLSFRSFVMTLTGSFGGRLSRSLLCANAPVETTPSIAITNNFRVRLIISSLSSSCLFPRTGGRKRCAAAGGSKKGATSVWPRSLSGTAEIRTVSHYFAPYRAAARTLREPPKSTKCTNDLLRASPGRRIFL
jgi:hypothetical protein